MTESRRLRIWLEAVVLLCFLPTRVLGVQQLKFHEAAALDGIVPSTEALFQEADTSELRCARLCSGRPDCEAFTLLAGREGSCHGFRSAVELTGGGEVVSGAKTFVIEVNDCQELEDSARSEEVIELRSDLSGYRASVLCDGPWLVFQKRQNGIVDFYRDWDDYRAGFGDLQNEFWLGLEAVRQLTSQGRWNLRVDLRDRDGNSAYAIYSNFRLGSEDSFYSLLYDSFTEGTAGDSLGYHRGQPFTTQDSDHDDSDTNCAIRYHGAWWYRHCHNSNLNGGYNNAQTAMGLSWLTWKGHSYSLPFTQMKIQKA